MTADRFAARSPRLMGVLFAIGAYFTTIIVAQFEVNVFWLLPAVLVVTGVTVSVRYWRCADCGRPLPTKFRVPDVCPRCGRVLRDAASY